MLQLVAFASVVHAALAGWPWWTATTIGALAGLGLSVDLFPRVTGAKLPNGLCEQLVLLSAISVSSAISLTMIHLVVSKFT